MGTQFQSGENNIKDNISNNSDVIAIIPAAGKATRLPDISCSKEIYPIAWQPPGTSVKDIKEKPVCFYLLENLSRAGINKGIMIIREEKSDIVKTLGDGCCVNMDITFDMLKLPYGTAYTIDQAYPLVKDQLVAIGFPDILFSAKDAFTTILNTLRNSTADVVLGLFPADRPHKVDMVNIDTDMNVTEIDIKPQSTSLTLTWGIAVWKPTFTQLLHKTLKNLVRQESDPELFIGDVIRIAINKGLKVKAEQVSDVAYLDIGTPDDLARAINPAQKK